MVGRTTVSSRGSTGSESFVLMWVHFLNSVGCNFNNQRRGLFLDRVRHQRTVPARADGEADGCRHAFMAARMRPGDCVPQEHRSRGRRLTSVPDAAYTSSTEMRPGRAPTA